MSRRGCRITPYLLKRRVQPIRTKCSGAGQQWAVGQNGSRSQRTAEGTWASDTDRMLSPPTYQDWHGCDIDPDGTLWTVGGRIASRPLTSGVIGVQGPVIPSPLPW